MYTERELHCDLEWAVSQYLKENCTSNYIHVAEAYDRLLKYRERKQNEQKY